MLYYKPENVEDGILAFHIHDHDESGRPIILREDQLRRILLSRIKEEGLAPYSDGKTVDALKHLVLFASSSYAQYKIIGERSTQASVPNARQ